MSKEIVFVLIVPGVIYAGLIELFGHTADWIFLLMMFSWMIGFVFGDMTGRDGERRTHDRSKRDTYGDW